MTPSPEQYRRLKASWVGLLALALLGHLLLSLALHALPVLEQAAPLRPLRADSITSRLRVRAAIEAGRAGDVRFLTAEVAPHLKLYGLWGSAAARLVPRLSTERAAALAVVAVNAGCYLLLLWTLGRLAQDLFGPRAGTWAVALALFPSLLLHFTQPLRDPLYLVLLVAFLRACAQLASAPAPGDDSPWPLLRQGGLALLLLLLLWRVRAEAMPLLLVCAGGTALLALALAARQGAAARPRLALGQNGAAALVLCGPLLWTLLPDDACRYETAAQEGRPAPLPAGSWRPARCPAHSPLASADRVRWLRSKFLHKYPGARSNIDTQVDLQAPRDILGYLPRALMLAAWAPFPWQWPALGPLPLRILVGGELLVLYGLQALVVYGLWRGAYRHPGAWLLLLFALASMAALGLSVANLGALYRLRYGFLLVCVVLAVGALPGSARGVGSRERSRGEHPGNH